MSAYDRMTVYQTMLATRLVPLFYHADPEVARQLLYTCVQGGSQMLEFTNRGDRALAVYQTLDEIIRREKLPIILGVGSIYDAPTAALFIAHGANFVVSPAFNAEIARLCNRRKIAYLPGCATPAEISTAEEYGAEIVKIFPSGALGPAFLQAVLGPSPWSRLMPTGGVEPREESIRLWRSAGAACIGMGVTLFRQEWLQASNYDAIRQAIAHSLAVLQNT